MTKLEQEHYKSKMCYLATDLNVMVKSTPINNAVTMLTTGAGVQQTKDL